MNNQYKNIDEVFKSRLDKLEEPFDSQAWDQMLQKLEKDEKSIVSPVPVYKKSNIQKITIMTTTAIILASILYVFQPENKAINHLNDTSMVLDEITTNKGGNHNANQVPTSNHGVTSEPPMKTEAPISSSFSNVSQSNKWSENKSNLSNINIYNDISTRWSEKYIQPFASKSYMFQPYLVESPNDFGDKLEQILGKPKKKYRYNGPWVGLHMAFAAPTSDMHKQGYRNGWGGNMELMSGDIVRSKQLGIFLGGGFGILQHGSGSNSGVMLQTPNNDSGYTYLYNMNFNFDLVARFEFGNYRLKPYVDLVLGARGMNTYQRIDSKKDIQGFESSDITITNYWGMHTGASLGLRYHLVPGLSLDGRVTYYSGDKFSWTDVKKSTYNQGTGTYKLDTRTSNLDMLHFRLGLLFELNEIDWNSNSGYGNNGSESHTISGGGGGGNGGGSSPKGMKIQTPRK